MGERLQDDLLEPQENVHPLSHERRMIGLVYHHQR